MRKLQREPGMIDKYDEIIQEQLKEKIVERVFYILHKPVKRETSTTTKLRIVFDASAKPSDESPSLNECLETGPLYRTCCGMYLCVIASNQLP